MSDENKPKDQEDSGSGLLTFWNNLDLNIKRILVGALVLLVLYYLMSPLQQCKRNDGLGTRWCYANTSW
jgi:hypothetical protein